MHSNQGRIWRSSLILVISLFLLVLFCIFFFNMEKVFYKQKQRWISPSSYTSKQKKKKSPVILSKIINILLIYLFRHTWVHMALPSGAVVKNLPAKCRRCRRLGFDPWFGTIPGSRKWQPTPVFLPGKPLGQRSLVGYRLWSHKESDTTEHARTQHEYTYFKLVLSCPNPPPTGSL